MVAARAPICIRLFASVTSTRAQPQASWIRGMSRHHRQSVERSPNNELRRPQVLTALKPVGARRWQSSDGGSRSTVAVLSPVGGRISKATEEEVSVEDRRGADGAYSVSNPRRLGQASAVEWGKIYFELGKGKLSGLVTLTAAAGYVVATPVGVPIHLGALAITCAGTVLSSMGASAYNQCMEIPNDSRMKRTSRRPLVTGKISQLHAFIAATTAGCSGVALLALCVNPLTAGLAAGNIGLYALVYTPLKQHSIWNTWLGAVVGAIPPMMGWAAVTGGLGTGGWVMGAMLFSWQIPHFLSLAYMMRADYKAGGYFMMPGDPGSAGLRQATVACMRHAAYLEILCLASASPLLGLAHPLFAVEATVLNAAYFWMAYQLHQAGASGNAGKTNTAAKRLFLASLAYLPLVLAFMCLHRAVAPAGDASCPYMEANKLVGGNVQK